MDDIIWIMPIVLVLLRFFLFVWLPFVFILELIGQFMEPQSKEKIVEKRPKPNVIIVKSRSVIGQLEPTVDKDTPKEKPIENEDKFANGESKKASAAIPDEQLDEAFSNNEKMDIDVEVETEEDEGLTLESDMEDEELVALIGDITSGVSLDEMNQTIETITNPAPSHIEQEQAVGVINKVLSTDMMQQVINSISGSESRIEQLLNECEKRYERTLVTKQVVAKKLPSTDFSLDDYIN